MARPYLDKASELLVRTKANGFDIVAHSMGSLLFMEAMVQSDLRGDLGSSGRIKNVVFAAPDIDIDLFRSQMGQIRNAPGNIYIYETHEDEALHISRLVAGGVDRVGLAHAEEFHDLGVTVIDLSHVAAGTGHSHVKYSAAPDIVRMIGRNLAQEHFDERLSDAVVMEYAAE
jgi:esterase/lipase superfamily enzyme